MNEQIEAMRKLGMSEEEIADVLESDKRIDKGEKLFELDPELEEGAKKARQADRKPTAYNFQKRERKADTGKRDLISALTCIYVVTENSEFRKIRIRRIHIVELFTNLSKNLYYSFSLINNLSFKISNFLHILCLLVHASACSINNI